MRAETPPDEPRGETTTEAETVRRGDAPWQKDREARHRRQISAEVVHEAIRFEGETELDRSSGALFWSGLAAGLTMGLSLAAQGLLRAGLPDTPWRPLVDSFGYTLGFVFVVAARQQLFTENTLTPILPLLHRWGRFPDVLRLWGVVLFANLLGAAVFAFTAALTPVFATEAKLAFAEIAREATSPGAGTLFVRAIVAGWLIALMVWLMPAAEHARLAMIILPTWLISVAHLAHSIAGSVDAFYLVAVGESTALDFARFLGPTLLGNVVGGVSLVAVLNHAQVVSGTEKNPDEE